MQGQLVHLAGILKGSLASLSFLLRSSLIVEVWTLLDYGLGILMPVEVVDFAGWNRLAFSGRVWQWCHQWMGSTSQVRHGSPLYLHLRVQGPPELNWCPRNDQSLCLSHSPESSPSCTLSTFLVPRQFQVWEFGLELGETRNCISRRGCLQASRRHQQGRWIQCQSCVKGHTPHRRCLPRTFLNTP